MGLIAEAPYPSILRRSRRRRLLRNCRCDIIFRLSLSSLAPGPFISAGDEETQDILHRPSFCRPLALGAVLFHGALRSRTFAS